MTEYNRTDIKLRGVDNVLSDQDYVRQSLELNLFFMRIAKEHSIFLEAGLPCHCYSLICEAEFLKNEFSKLLKETIRLSEGIVSPGVLNSGELVTDMTLDAERETQYYSGIKIDSSITISEMSLEKENLRPITPKLVKQVNLLNQRALAATMRIAGYKAKLLQDVLACRLFTFNYPLLIDHVLREAKFYLRMLDKLQKRESFDMVKEAVFEENFWNRIMAEHAKFIRGLLDPTEVQLFNTANDFGKKFDDLTAEANAMVQNIGLLPSVTDESLKAATDIRDFKKQGTQGIIECKIRSIAYPLLGDHVVREANHYIRMLNGFKNLG